jgi:hypothetical protein
MAVTRGPSTPQALAALVAANLLPLAGVAWFGWGVFDVLLVYWVESGVVGLLNVSKVLMATGAGDAGATFTVNGRSVDVSPPDSVAPDAGPQVYWSNLPAAGFFCAHYGIFWVVHGAFVVFALPGVGGGPSGSVDVAAVLLGGAAMVASHGGSFLWNFVGRGEYRDVSPGQQMTEPYRRVFVLHLTIVLGAFLVASAGSPLALLVLMVVLKTGFDAAAHLREHRRATDRRPERGREARGPTT